MEFRRPTGVLVLLGVLGLTSCDSHQNVGPNVVETLDPIEEGRRRYEDIRTHVGASCEIDSDCTAPLRYFENACAEPPAMVGEGGSDVPTVLFYAAEGEVSYDLEIVDTDAERRRGLMFRPWMEDDWGMIFIYDRPSLQNFWMRNTYISLDMVFIDPQGVVVGVVEHARPLDDTRLNVNRPSQYVIELNAGQAEAHGIAEGVICELLNFPEGMLTSPE